MTLGQRITGMTVTLIVGVGALAYLNHLAPGVLLGRGFWIWLVGELSAVWCFSWLINRRRQNH